MFTDLRLVFLDLIPELLDVFALLHQLLSLAHHLGIQIRNLALQLLDLTIFLVDHDPLVLVVLRELSDLVLGVLQLGLLSYEIAREPLGGVLECLDFLLVVGNDLVLVLDLLLQLVDLFLHLLSLLLVLELLVFPVLHIALGQFEILFQLRNFFLRVR
ncbi:hypothetical protein B0T09DRAFT_326363, partial [Sordaria sp. MPI-SDFR-AT-0083]